MGYNLFLGEVWLHVTVNTHTHTHTHRYLFPTKNKLKYTLQFYQQNGPVQCSEEEAHQLLDHFVSAGGNFIDTADVYQNGKAEEILGNWLIK